jgi:hypothetical protein
MDEDKQTEGKKGRRRATGREPSYIHQEMGDLRGEGLAVTPQNEMSNFRGDGSTVMPRNASVWPRREVTTGRASEEMVLR